MSAADSQRLVVIQQLWHELQAARKDPEKYQGLAERIRNEADLLREQDYPPKPES